MREGIHLSGASQYLTTLRKLGQKLDTNGLGDVRLIGPDLSGSATLYVPSMLTNSLVMSKIEHFSVHNYVDSNSDTVNTRSLITNSVYRDRTVWVTEFNVWCPTCDSGTRSNFNWQFCEGTAKYLLNHLLGGASAGLVWEGYDSYYAHHGAWGFWGLFSVDNENAATKTYTPRKHFYTVAQISKWVRPGAQRINVSGTTSPFSPLLAFKHTGLGQITIVGINTSGSAATLNGTLNGTNASLPAVPHLDLYYTSATTNLASGGSVPVTNGTFSATIPADCVFTLTFSPNPPSAPVANAATGVTNSEFTVNLSSVDGATGYRLDVSTNSEFGNFLSGYQDLNVGNVTNRNVTGLTAGGTYYYRVRASSTNGTSGNSGTIAVTLVTADPCVAILNSDFESGFSLAGGGYIANNWTEWEATTGNTIGYDETSIVHGGVHTQRIRVWGGTNGTSGGVFQRVPVIAGKPYTVSVWIYAADTASACYLGVDPAGGTNANNGVTWSAGTTNVAWMQETWTGIATASYITVYYKVASSDNNKRNGYFDDATPTLATGPLQLVAQGNGDALTLTWAECPNARLERSGSFIAPMSWATATNQVSVVGGQKTVTLTSAEGAGFFRLVLE